MNCFDSIDKLDLSRFPRPHVVTVGMFDGLHRGHQRLVRRIVELAKPSYGNGSGTAIVLSFANHPLSVLAPPYTPKRLTSTTRKKEILADIGADILIMPQFKPELANMCAPDFVEQVLVGRLQADTVIAGFDFCFGKNGEGNGQLLTELSHRYGFSVEVLPALYHGEWVISSTRIRELIEEGRVRLASEMLGRPYDMEGPVVHGFGRGRNLGYPTANVQFDPSFASPASGVYAVVAQIENKSFAGMMNIGTSPTFGDAEYRAEAFLFDYDGESLYDRVVRIHFIDRIREERKFASVDELLGRLRVDEKLARALTKTTNF